MATPPEKDMVERFQEMAQDFKSKTDGVMGEINAAFATNVGAAIKNYTEMLGNYVTGYTGITTGAQKASKQLVESMDKHFTEFKKQFHNLYTETVSKTDGSLASGTKDFQTQCEDIVKKFPMIPANTYKDVLTAVDSSKGKLNSAIEKQYKEVADKIDKHYVGVRKEMAMADLKVPTIPPLDVSPSLMDTAKAALTSAMNTAQPLLKNLTEQKSAADAGKKK